MNVKKSIDGRIILINLEFDGKVFTIVTYIILLYTIYMHQIMLLKDLNFSRNYNYGTP